ncbi:hypothetical protein PMAYCL1PPCAC_20894 [Pristionchus mayeri]|uniref:CHK kinase-like domain-containing protein n=1 Tax=Pristionchus mayeri TaxID=1317129 RepID=A0AAN5I3W1_9BILA|nr:hypothetical protein PMAYCL1PPCAC_20894 [Pristionchus mayeri]
MLETYRDDVIRLIAAAGFELAAPNLLELKKIGAGCVSSIFRVKLKNDGTIVVKITEKDDLLIRCDLHNRELELYQWISELRNEKDEVKCPNFYGGQGCNEEMGIILMEDLSPRISNSFSFTTGFCADGVLKIVRELAAIQSTYLSTLHDLENSFSSTYGAPMISHELPLEGMRFDFTSFELNCLPKIEQIDGLTSEMQSKLREWIVPVPLFKMQTEMPTKTIDVSPTLIHCDLWPENIMFDRSENVLSIIDWQCFKIGNPLLDIASVLGIGMQPADRRACTDAVVKCYVKEMDKRKGDFKRPFEINIGKAHRFLALSLRYACVQLMAAIVTLTDEDLVEHPAECQAMAERLAELMKDVMKK